MIPQPHVNLNAPPWSAVPFSDAVELMDVLFWDRRRPRLQLSPLEKP